MHLGARAAPAAPGSGDLEERSATRAADWSGPAGDSAPAAPGSPDLALDSAPSAPGSPDLAGDSAPASAGLEGLGRGSALGSVGSADPGVRSVLPSSSAAAAVAVVVVVVVGFCLRFGLKGPGTGLVAAAVDPVVGEQKDK